MLLSYQRGDVARPRGHALVYFTSWSDPAAVFATYLIVPPIAVEISKYIPPMFASQLQGMQGAAGITFFPYPPIPEQVEGEALLERLAAARDDDLISGGSVDTSSPERLLQAATEAGQQYFGSFSAYISSYSPAEPEPLAEIPAGSVSVDANELRYILMGERERLRELTVLIGQLRDSIAGDPSLMAATEAEIRVVGKLLPDKYRVDETLLAAREPGPQGLRLTQLYLDRAFRLADEKYEAVAELEAEIRSIKGD